MFGAGLLFHYFIYEICRSVFYFHKYISDIYSHNAHNHNHDTGYEPHTDKQGEPSAHVNACDKEFYGQV